MRRCTSFGFASVFPDWIYDWITAAKPHHQSAQRRLRSSHATSKRITPSPCSLPGQFQGNCHSAGYPRDRPGPPCSPGRCVRAARAKYRWPHGVRTIEHSFTPISKSCGNRSATFHAAEDRQPAARRSRPTGDRNRDTDQPGGPVDTNEVATQWFRASKGPAARPKPPAAFLGYIRRLRIHACQHGAAAVCSTTLC